MPNKTQEYLNLAQQTAKELTRYWENWTDYLTTASRLYKYSYADQLMIYAQRPDATACASFDLWNNRMNRYALGAAVSDMSREVLRNIERTVKKNIRRRNAERSQYEYEQQERDLLDRRGLPAPEPDPEPARKPLGKYGRLRRTYLKQHRPVLYNTMLLNGSLYPHLMEVEQTAESRMQQSMEQLAEAEPSPGQGAESDGVGAAHEQPESASRGTGADGADLQLSFFDAHIPTEAEQIGKIDQAESEKLPSAFVLSQAEIENELRKHGSGFAGGKQRIMALYQTQPDRKLRAKALAKEYGIGGHSHDFLDGSRGFVNHDWKGLEFDHYPDHQKITLKWTQVEQYIDLMIQSDRYLTDKEKEQRTARQEAECQLPMLDGTVAAEYTALKKQYPNTLVALN